MSTPIIIATRRGISGILGAVLFFAIIFTVLSTYIAVQYDSNQLIEDTVSARVLSDVEQQNEDFVLKTILSSGNTIGFVVNNTGQKLINVVGAFVHEPSGEIANRTDGSKAIFSGSPLFPVSAGTSSPVFNTGVTYQDGLGVFMVRVLTDKGNMGSASYPEIRVAFAEVEGFEERIREETEAVIMMAG